MKNFLYALNVSLAGMIVLTAFGCSDNSYEKIPENNGQSTPAQKETEEVSTEHWAALADSCTYVLIDNFMDKSKGTFWTTPKDVEGTTWNAYWQQGPSIEVVLASYERIKESNPTLAKTYLSYFEKWYANDANNYNNTYDKVGDYGGFFNQWIDDMGAICIALMHMAQATGTEKYAKTAKDIFDIYIWPKAKSNSKGIGLPWTYREEDADNLNSTANNTSGLAAIMLYNWFHVTQYLSTAKTLYAFNLANMIDDERVEEPPLSYTQGYFAEAGRLLYHATGNVEYMNKTGVVLSYCFTSSRCKDSKIGILRHEGTDVNQSIFKSIYVPYAVNYILDEKADKETRKFLHDKILLCAQTLEKNLDRKYYPQMYCDYFWGTTFSEGTPSMGAQTSGASLMESTARMEASYQF